MDVDPSPFPEDFSKLLHLICKNAAELLHAQASSVFLKEPDSNRFKMRAAHGYSAKLVHKAEYEPGEGITGWIAQGHEYRANSHEEMTADPRRSRKYDKDVWETEEHQCFSMVGVPLHMGKGNQRQVYGLIKVENKRDGETWKAFTDQDLQSLKIFVSAISHVIETNSALMATLGRLYVFVLMPFNNKFKNLFDFGIETAISEAGMRCMRIDSVAFTEDIVHKIHECIAQADIVVSVVTGQSANVFYETGYAHALGKPTIPLTETDDDVPFDLRNVPIINYSSDRISDLKAKLYDRLVGLRTEMKSYDALPKTPFQTAIGRL